MDFTVTFLRVFIITVYFLSPLLLVLNLAIMVLGLAIGRMEKWSIFDSLYYAFITATTVGYGDFRPRRQGAKVLAIIVAVIGICLGGIIVAIGLKSVETAFNVHYDAEQIQNDVLLRVLPNK